MSDLIKKLEQLNSKNILADIDLVLCRFLKEQDPSTDDNILLAAAMVSHKYSQGDVCLELDEHSISLLAELFPDLNFPELKPWLKQLKNSDLVGKPTQFKPLVLEADHRLYLQKLWYYENELAQNIIKKSGFTEKVKNSKVLADGLEKLFPQNEDEKSTVNWQKVAAVMAILSRFTVISGGPGTGKTSTVIRILALLFAQAEARGHRLSVALAAPTGKAASRLEQSILASKQELAVSDTVKQAIPTEAVTLHQLLGARRHTARYKYNSDNPLPFDVIIIDEASMVDQALMSKLMEAMLQKTKLIILGDKDQLSSVEAGSVLGNICRINTNQFSVTMADRLNDYSISIPKEHILNESFALTDNIILLQKNYRFKDGSGIAVLSDAVKKGDVGNSLAVLNSEVDTDVQLTQIADAESFEAMLQNLVGTYGKAITHSSTAEDYFQVYQQQRILSAHRLGPQGVEYINGKFEQLFKKRSNIPSFEQWYAGRPVIISRNNHRLGLFNGDIGLCIKNEEGAWRIAFQRDREMKLVAPSRLPPYELAYALTIHKGQGSEFEEVAIILPHRASRLLSRELLYTGITRARKKVSVIGKQEILESGIQKEINRSSGLHDRLWS